MRSRITPLAALLFASVSFNAHAVSIAVEEDVMTSSFFTGADLVRGYAADGRRVMRVSTDEPFGLVGAETIYLKLGYDFSAFSGPVNAVLTVQSADGGFGANAGPGNPFTVSAHAVSADPLTSITDNTNPGGTINWLAFYTNNILAADPLARTSVSSFGAVQINVSAIVNGWISGTNPVHAIALTGKNDTSGNEFLHGFLDNSITPGSTFLTITAVPEPETYAMFLAGVGIVVAAARRRHASARREVTCAA